MNRFRWLGPVILVLTSGLFTGCKLPLVWESPVSPDVPVPSSTPDLALTLPGTPGTTEVDPPEATVIPSNTPVPTSPPATPAPTRLPYILQPGAPAAGPNFSHPDLGCAWSGVAGQVLDAQRNPVEKLFIEVRGLYDGKDIETLTMTGTAPSYGPGGYEIQLGERPVASTGALNIRVFDATGLDVSEIYSFDTFGTCEQNLVLITFVEALDFPGKWFLPFVSE